MIAHDFQIFSNFARLRGFTYYHPRIAASVLKDESTTTRI